MPSSIAASGFGLGKDTLQKTNLPSGAKEGKCAAPARRSGRSLRAMKHAGRRAVQDSILTWAPFSTSLQARNHP
jgi:hypothetical protein